MYYINGEEKQVKKGVRLLWAALGCIVALSGAVIFCSSAVPEAVAPLPEIEVIWNIEDTRGFSEIPLLSELIWNGGPLAHSEEGTFFCPLGLEHGEEWPELTFLLPDGISACFADDYLWDACGNAIAQGIPYRLLVWTESQYCYQNIVFTGLPVISLSCACEPEEILAEDIPAEVSVLTPERTFISYARIHRRGGGSFFGTSQKRGYRIELTLKADGKRKAAKTIPWFGEADTFVLLPIADDETKIRERLGWELWNRLCSAEEPLGQRKAGYCEVFLNGNYRGVYLALQPYDAKAELARAGLENSGSVYRTAAAEFLRGRSAVEDPLFPKRAYRYFAFDGNDPAKDIESYATLLTCDDSEFRRRFEQQADTDSFLRYDLYLQACGLGDNVYNNMYIWSAPNKGIPSFHLAPWDLDISFGFDYLGPEYGNWIFFPVMDRAINLNCNHLRTRLREQWEAYRDGVFSSENVTALIDGFAMELNESGAMARDAERWQTGQYISEPQSLLDYWQIRMNVLDRATEMIAEAEGKLDFLIIQDYEQRAGPIGPE